MQKRIIIILSLLLAIFLFILYQGKMLDDRFTSFQSSNERGTVIKAMPKVEFKYLDSDKHYDFFQSDKGKNSLFLHFWATWCGPCEAEFPKLSKLIQESKDENITFVFVAVNDELPKIKKFLKRFPDLDAVIALDNDFIHQKHFGTYKLPETFLFDKTGKIIKKHTGAKNWASEMLKSL